MRTLPRRLRFHFQCSNALGAQCYNTDQLLVLKTLNLGSEVKEYVSSVDALEKPIDAICKCCIVACAAIDQLRVGDYTLSFLGEVESAF